MRSKLALVLVTLLGCGAGPSPVDAGSPDPSMCGGYEGTSRVCSCPGLNLGSQRCTAGYWQTCRCGGGGS